MFFVGHMTWAYVLAALFSGKQQGKLFVPAILILGILPDIDILLRDFGVIHHTFTHSLFFWLAIFAPLLVIFRLRSIPYLVAVLQHFAFGDFIVGNVMIFWPFSTTYFGLRIPMTSVLDVSLEIAALPLAAGIMYLNGDLTRLRSANTQNIPMFLPLLALLTSMLFFAVDWPIIPLAAYIWSSPSLTTIVLAHTILVMLLAISLAQGLRKLINIQSKRVC